MSQFDHQAMHRNFNRKIKALPLSRETADQLLERLQLIKQQPKSILDLGCGTGDFTYRLSKLYPKAKVLGLDIAEQRLKYAKKQRPWFNKTRFMPGNIENLPFPDNSFDLIVSNLSLYWVKDLNQAFKEIQRVLKPEGVLLFSSLGPDTLLELRESLAQIDNKPHVNVFLDMHDVGDALLKAGLKDPVMDVETLTQQYSSLLDLLKELHEAGESNAHCERSKGLMGKQALQKLESYYEQYRSHFEKLPATFEVIYGHALGTEMLSKLENGEVHIPLSKIGIKSTPPSFNKGGN
ncbi:MAG: malonyl-[acyl-carrier protein] O-methyltransferase BioC [Gammaproteobacteria bacterium]|jgi:malonyl-CoA O-methyltransferase|nr:malonyl-[acyl-carrier protein] O-methyltransferase BioC [Gammaproteobacteria bacterium]